MNLTFHGAAGGVTGSMHEIEVGGRRYLLDCGMFQGRRKESEHLNRDFPIDASSIDAVVLSHAHIDHSGRMPLLVKNGFGGPIYATSASRRPLSGHAERYRRTSPKAMRNSSIYKHPDDPPVEPLYTMEDAVRTMPLFRPVPYHSEPLSGEGLDDRAL